MKPLSRSPSHAVYRAMPLTEPEVSSADDLLEITLAWGDDILSVTHLHHGARFEHAFTDGSSLLLTHGAVTHLHAPESASAWVVREGLCASRPSNFTLPPEARACVEHLGVSVRVRRVPAPDPLPRPSRVTRFSAAVTCALALATTGGLQAQSLDDDAALELPREDPHPWIVAHLRPWTPPPAPSLPPVETHAPSPWVGFCGCFVTRSLWPSLRFPFAPSADASDSLEPFIGLAPEFDTRTNEAPSTGRISVIGVEVSGLARADDVRRVIREHRVDVARCHAEGLSLNPHAAGQLRVRFVLDDRGRVLAAGLSGSTLPGYRVADCVTERVRTWRFTPIAQGNVATVNASFALR